MALLPLIVQQQRLFKNVLAVIFTMKKKIELGTKCILWLEQRIQICVFLLAENVPTRWPSGMFSSIAGL
jgi:hypothetical protein